MKKNFIKVLFMTVSALLCSQIWAQGSESVSSEVDRQFETSYSIKVHTGVNSSMKVYTLGLTSENGSTKITNGFQPTEGYTAFFVCDDNTYYKYDYDSGINIWKKCSNTEKGKLENLYNKLLNRNVVFTTEGNENFLSDTSFTEIDENELEEISTAKNKKFLRSDDKGFSDLYVYNKRKGVFVYAVKLSKTSKVHVICFRDKRSIAEIKPDNIDENTFYNNYQTWLEKTAENKLKDSNNTSYKMLSVLIYDTLNKSMRKENGHFANLYNTDSNVVIRKYLQTAMKNNRNVYFSELEQNKKAIIASKFESITKNEGLKIAQEAQKYLDHSVEKKGVRYDKNIILALIEWLTNNSGRKSDEYFDNTGNKGYGLPYLEKSFDTPRTFNNKIIKNNNAKGGCDDIGFLNGILYSSNIKTYVPVNTLDKIYNEYLNSISNSTSYEIGEQLISFSDLNKISMPVSDLTEASVGDIIIFDKTATRNNGNSVSEIKKKIGIIVEPVICNQVFGTNQKQSLGNLTVIWMNEEKGAEKTKLSEIWKTEEGFEVPKFTEIRRILKNGNSSNANINWNVYDNKVVDANVEINWMRESTQVSGEQYRWIPNTGEYLSLEKIKFHAYNQLGVSVKGNSWRVFLSGAKDRDWTEGNTQGNIYNNSGCKFDIQLGDKTGILQKNSTDKSRYDISWTNCNSDYGPEFIIEADNLLYYYDYSMNYGIKRPVELKIRPESSEAARPGDDLLLEFTLREINTDKKFTITVPADNYIAVYDKKMLWRANLYLNKPEDTLGGEDWNNAHPWDAPNSDSYDSNIWFGKNEWNNPETNYDGVPGGQVISIPSTKWYHGTNLSAGDNNKRAFDSSVQKDVINATAYDYQGWDSPYSYNDKLKIQKNLMNLWYSDSGTKFNTRVDAWPENCDTFTTIEQFITYLGEKSVGSETDLDKLKKLYKKFKTNKDERWNGELNTKNYNEYVFDYNYGKLQSPYNDGLSPQFFDEKVLKAENNEAAYIPGLSNSIMYEGSGYPNGKISKIVAGVDCIGFVQRSAAYGTKENTIYSALKNKSFFDPPMWNNDTVPNSPSAIDNFHSTNYAVKISDKNNPKKSETIIENGVPVVRKLYESLKYAVPGDIVWYSGQHIMIISYISAPSGNDGLYIQDDVNVIESVYNNLAVTYGVGKNRNLNKLKSSASSDVKDWEIWRQK